MNSYKFNDDTLIHTCGLNISSFVGILENGILSYDYAKKNGFSFVKNYYGSNLNDCISCVRFLYVNEEVVDSSYSVHVKNGISFLIEDVDFIFDKDSRIIHRSDEVLVKDFIPVDKIKGILISNGVANRFLDEIEYIKERSTSYLLVKENCDRLKEFILSNGGNLSFEYDILLHELYLINEAYGSESDEDEKLSLRNDFIDVIHDLNYVIGLDMQNCFSNILNKDDIRFIDVINYFNSQKSNLPIYYIAPVRESFKGKRSSI